MKSPKFLVVVAVFLALTLGGCASPPQEKIDAANAALEEARSAEAEKYVPQAWSSAKDAVDSAMAEVQAQQAKFALFRSYTDAEGLLDKAVQTAKDVVTQAQQAKEEARLGAETLIAEAEKAITDAGEALKTAPRGKGTAAEIEAMKAELETLTGSVAEARQTYEAGDYLGAQATAKAAKEKAESIIADIAQAKAKRT